ncbi:MAG: hypothetical protein LKI34_02965 [Bifidobacterium tibiigranuli]|jgi:hypothetical protein|uniref:hypothetical protein n=1 Tax=Bifidobacterium tibiigranuli TaxID=2172043 RepID=UPI0026EF1F00|nr:hypothetical protein [Bifidobacterium tibiigranuli]MCI1673168.1 hypothetical protein [Bifidobacterium tibiigranuli]MCI1713587.1 hypothetical protein [Bifidobacterium tibiigranuli]
MTRTTHRGAAQGERRMDGTAVARHITHSHYPEDLLELALADSDVIEAMRDNRYDIRQDAPDTDAASRHGGRLGFGYFTIPTPEDLEKDRSRAAHYREYRRRYRATHQERCHEWDRRAHQRSRRKRS